MPVRNLTGTTESNFRIGLDGPTLYRAQDDPVSNPPTPIGQFRDGDLILRTDSGGLYVRQSGSFMPIMTDQGGTFQGPVQFQGQVTLDQDLNQDLTVTGDLSVQGDFVADGTTTVYPTGGITNLCPNPNFDWWPNGASGSGSTMVPAAGDWWINFGDSWVKSTDAPSGSRYSLETTHSGDRTTLSTRIPPEIARTLVGKTISTRIYVKSTQNSVDTIRCRLSYPSIEGDFSNSNVVQIEENDVSASTGSWVQVEHTFSPLIQEVANGLEIRYILIGTGSGPTTTRIAQAQVHIGDTVPQFEAPNSANYLSRNTFFVVDENLIKNPNFNFWDQNSGSGTGTNTEPLLTQDVPGWHIRNSDFTFTRLTDVPNVESEYSLQVERTSGAASHFLYSFIPPTISKHLVGQQLALSFYGKMTGNLIGNDLQIQFSTLSFQGAVAPGDFVGIETQNALSSDVFEKVDLVTSSVVPSSGENGVVIVFANQDTGITGGGFVLSQVTLTAGDQPIPIRGTSFQEHSLTDKATPLQIQHREPSGTNGGTASSGAWRTRPLNWVEQEKPWATLVNDQITLLQPGRYYLEGGAVVYHTQRTQSRIQDITNGTTLITGLVYFSGSAYDITTFCEINGEIIIRDETIIEFQQEFQNTHTTTGYGVDAGFSDYNVYADLKIWKLQ